MTYIFMGICFILYIFTAFQSINFMDLDPNVLAKYGGLITLNNMNENYFELYRILTSVFLHAGIIHLLCNMYSLYIIGPQLESFFG